MINFPVFIQPYTQHLLIMYQIETVPVPIIDLNKQVDSYTHLQIERSYIALNCKTYISIRQQELQTCEKIGYEFSCEDLFIVKHKTKYSCEGAIYFYLGPDIIKQICKFTFYYNKTDITSTVPDGGSKIILANFPNDKHIICNINNDMPFLIASHPYVLVNKSVLCNCGMEVENNFLLESLVACHITNSK